MLQPFGRPYALLKTLILLLITLKFEFSFAISTHAVTLDDGTISIVSGCPGETEGVSHKGLCVSRCPKGVCSSSNPVQALTNLSEDIDKIVMTLSAGGKIVLAYRADCDGRSPCLALCADSLCQTVESTGLEPLIIPSNTNDGQKSIAGYAPSIGFNSDDKPAVAYLHSTKENHTAPEVISLKVALCNHSRCESFTIHNVANFSTSDIPDASQTTTLVAFDVNDGLHVALARNDSVLVFRCADPHACHSWQQTNTIFLPGVVTSISLLPSSAGPGDERTLVAALSNGITQSMQCVDDFASCTVTGVVDSPRHIVAQDISVSTEISINKDGDAVKMLTTAVATFSSSNVSSVTLVACADKTCYFNITRSVVWSHVYTERDRERRHKSLSIKNLLPQVGLTSQLDSPRPFLAIRTAMDGNLRAIMCQSVDCAVFTNVIIADNSTRILHAQSRLGPAAQKPLVDWAVVAPIIAISVFIIGVAIIYSIGRCLKKQAKQKIHEKKKEQRRRLTSNRQMNQYGSIAGPAPPLMGSMNAAADDYQHVASDSESGHA